MVKVGNSGVARLLIAIVIVIFVLVPTESLVFLPLFVCAKGLDGLCDH